MVLIYVMKPGDVVLVCDAGGGTTVRLSACFKVE
jgi:hypothetical protein